MLDIGEGAGALVVYTSELLADQEIEIRPRGEQWAGVHTAVRARHLGAAVLHAGVFGSLAPGLYDLRVRPAPSAIHMHHAHGALGADGADDHAHSHGQSSAMSSPVMTVEVRPATVTETTLV
jgi:hypothetical protein